MGQSGSCSRFVYCYVYYVSGLYCSCYFIIEISVMKNFLIVLVIVIILVNCLGSLVDSWLGMYLIMLDELLSFWENVVVLLLVGVVFVIVGFVVVVSVMGIIFLVLGVGFLVLLVVGVSVFWLIIFIVIVLYVLKN